VTKASIVLVMRNTIWRSKSK